jgi:two-component system sensor histidine kinase PilS (NtrC family)
MQPMFDERNWLAWLVKVRIIILTFILGIELLVAQFTPSSVPLRLFVSAILLWYTLSMFYVVLLSFWSELRLQALLQVVTDLAMVTLVVHVTGGVDSSLNFLYPLVIVVACILLPRGWSYLIAALSFILYGAVLELNYYGLVPSYSTTHPQLTALQAIIFINLFAFLTIAYLAGRLSAKLRQASVQLHTATGELASLQALHENIIQSISGGLITTGIDGRITLANAAAQRLLERSEADLLDRSVSQLFLDALPDGSQRVHGEVRYHSPATGYRKTFRVLVSRLEQPGQETAGFVYTMDDLTELRRLEREVRVQDRLAAVGRLAAAIAHEIRNPLTSIAGSVSMLSGIPDLNEEHRQLLQIVTRESDRLNNIITDFLAYSRGKQFKFENVNLVPLLEDTLTLLENRLVSENSGVRIARKFSLKEARALADGDRIKQVFWNFCQNAVRAMKTGGTLSVSIDFIEEDWQISFSDTGPGIEPQLAEKIFEPFQSNFEGGTGLGLAIVYQIVQAHEGKVWARSKPGQGCTFILRLRRLATYNERNAKAVDRNRIAVEGSAPLLAVAAKGGARG